MSTTSEKHVFQAEVNEVLSLVVNSLYTHKEVFLRELISNASDALDHLSFRALTEPDLLGDDKELRVEIVCDEDAGTLTISDSGVGMTHEQLIQNLGTIAHSGSKKLVQSLSGDSGKDLSLIGQFGVGFYAAFLVADRVEVVSRAAGADGPAWLWESEAKGDFTLEETERTSRGTDVILHLREDERDFLKENALRQLARKYSDYVRHPIRLRVERTQPKEEGSDETETVVEWDQLNKGSALWTQARSEVTDEQYDEFYRHLTHDWEAPLARRHFKVEGVQELAGMLFVPKRAPFDMLDRNRRGIRLFVKRVFIMDECQELLPEYLRFVRGVVDSDDLPLNVSREFLQKDRTTAAIRKQIVRHALSMLEDLAESEAHVEPDSESGAETETGAESEEKEAESAAADAPYVIFWSQFGPVLKEGVHSDSANRDRIVKLLRYESSSADGLTSLAEYVERMDDEQPAIYYLTAQSRAAAEASPHIETLRKRGYEILYMTDPIDEWVVEGLQEFEGKKLVSAARGALDLPTTDDEKEALEEKAGAFAPLIDSMKATLADGVQDVRVTKRLTDSPACLVGDENALSPHIERLLRAQHAELPEQKRILEINPDHPVIARLQGLAESAENAERLEEWTRLLYDQALVAEGSPPSDPAGFTRRITALLEQVTG